MNAEDFSTELAKLIVKAIEEKEISRIELIGALESAKIYILFHTRERKTI